MNSKQPAAGDDRTPACSTQSLDVSVSSFLEAVSAGTPTPGGGSVAAFAGAVAAALGIMVCRVGPPADSSKPTQAPATPELGAVEQRLLALRADLQRLIQSDADAYAGVVTAYRLPKEDPARAATISANLATATEVPLETVTLATEAASLLRKLIPLTKPSVASDLKVGLLMALAAIEGGLENVKTNLKSIRNQDVLRKSVDRIREIEQSLVELRRL